MLLMQFYTNNGDMGCAFSKFVKVIAFSMIVYARYGLPSIIFINEVKESILLSFATIKLNTEKI
jgi:hypothetical protein